MSYELAAVVYRKKIGNATLKGLLGFIAHRTHDEHLEFYMSRKNIAEAVELSERQVIRLMKRLEDAGFLKHIGVHPRHKTQMYRFEIEHLQTLPDIVPAYLKAATSAKGDDNLSGGDKCDSLGVTNATVGGDTMSPNKKYNKNKKNARTRASLEAGSRLSELLGSHGTDNPLIENAVQTLSEEAEAFDGHRILIKSRFMADRCDEALRHILKASNLKITTNPADMQLEEVES